MMNRWAKKKMLEVIKRNQTTRRMAKKNYLINKAISKIVRQELRYAKEYDWGDEDEKEKEEKPVDGELI